MAARRGEMGFTRSAGNQSIDFYLAVRRDRPTSDDNGSLKRIHLDCRGVSRSFGPRLLLCTNPTDCGLPLGHGYVAVRPTASWLGRHRSGISHGCRRWPIDRGGMYLEANRGRQGEQPIYAEANVTTTPLASRVILDAEVCRGDPAQNRGTVRSSLETMRSGRPRIVRGQQLPPLRAAAMGVPRIGCKATNCHSRSDRFTRYDEASVRGDPGYGNRMFRVEVEISFISAAVPAFYLARFPRRCEQTDVLLDRRRSPTDDIFGTQVFAGMDSFNC